MNLGFGSSGGSRLSQAQQAQLFRGGYLGVPPSYIQVSSDEAIQLDAAADWAAVVFVPQFDFKLTSVSVYVTAEATQGDMTLSVYSVSGGEPDSELQELGTLDSGGSADTWVRLAIASGSQYQLYRGKQYALVIKGEASKDFSISGRRVNQAVDSMFPTSMLTAWTSADSGSNWAAFEQDSQPAMLNIIFNSDTDHVAPLYYGRSSGASVWLPTGVATIPEAGVSLDCTALTADTLYYVYLYDSSGTLTLEASTTAWTVDSTTGQKVKTGDTDKLYVGLIYPKELQTGKQGPIECPSRALVASVHNQPIRLFSKSCPFAAITGSTVPADSLESFYNNGDSYKLECVALPGDIMEVYSGATGAEVYYGVAFGVDSKNIHQDSVSSRSGVRGWAGSLLCTKLKEGFHYVYPLIWNDAGNDLPIYYVNTGSNNRQYIAVPGSIVRCD